MEKLLFKTISKGIFILFMLIIFVASYAIYDHEYKNNINELNELINQLSLSYAKQNEDKINEDLKKDYLNRLEVIDYMLRQHEQITNDKLNTLASMMEVDNISLINNQGVIIYSSNVDNVGINLKQYPKTLESIKELIENEDKTYNIDLNRSLIEHNDIVYMGLRVEAENYRIVEIGVDKKRLYKNAESLKINEIIKSMPTIYNRTIFMVNAKTNELEAIIGNNNQILNFGKVNDQNLNYDKLFKLFYTGGYANINGEKVILLTKNMGDKILGIYVSVVPLYKNIIYNITIVSIICGFIFIVIWLIVKKCVEEYALHDIKLLTDSILKIKSGKKNVDFSIKYDTELKRLKELLEWWNNSYNNKAKRMSHLVKCINADIGVFECLFELKQGFYTDTVKDILSIDKEKWQEYRNNPHLFKYFLLGLQKDYKFKDDYVFYKQKYIKINIFEEQNEFYGTVYDKTKEISQDLEMKRVKERSEIDLLTKVSNRKKLEEYMQAVFKTEQKSGLLLIFDLDNFKKVNDNEGHPVGDLVLKQFADCLKTAFRKQDLIARIGGDEFVIFIENDIDKILLKKKLEKLLALINKTMEKYNKLYNLSTSIGVAYIDESVNSYEDLYRYADAGLYIAKNLGKNRYYINERKIKCIKSNCTRCKGECVKSELLRLNSLGK